jgi:hypothetical protein
VLVVCDIIVLGVCLRIFNGNRRIFRLFVAEVSASLLRTLFGFSLILFGLVTLI